MTLHEFFRKMRGTTADRLPRVSHQEIIWSWLGSFLGIAALAWIDRLYFEAHDLALLTASFGASAVLVYGAVRSPLAQPRNLIVGHIISAVVGVACWKLLHEFPELAAGMAVSTAIAAMLATKTLHPPGGAVALIAVIGSDKIHATGFGYVLVPATIGPLLLLVIALIVNNIPSTRRYPVRWW